MQALADQLPEQDSLPIRLQEQLGALWAAQQATIDHDDDDPPTPKSTKSRQTNNNTTTNSSSSSGLTPQDDTPLFPTSPLAPDLTVGWALASSSVGLRQNSAVEGARVVRGGFGGVSPRSEVLVRSPEGEGEDLVALRSENSQLRAELARAGRVNELWGKGEYSIKFRGSVVDLNDLRPVLLQSCSSCAGGWEFQSMSSRRSNRPTHVGRSPQHRATLIKTRARAGQAQAVPAHPRATILQPLGWLSPSPARSRPRPQACRHRPADRQTRHRPLLHPADCQCHLLAAPFHPTRVAQ